MDYPVRKRLRLEAFDYRWQGYYFVTFCTIQKRKLFWDGAGATRGRPPLSSLGRIVERELRRIPQIYPGVRLDMYVVMPNHVHAILVIEGADLDGGRPRVAPTLSRMIQQTKGRITKQAGFPLWQKSFYDHIIRNEPDYRRICQYIDTNPSHWEEDEYFKG